MFLTYGLFNLTHLITITIILQIPKFISENPSFLAKKTNCYYIFGVCISFKYLIKKENNSINQSSIYQRMKESVERRRKKYFGGRSGKRRKEKHELESLL